MKRRVTGFEMGGQPAEALAEEELEDQVAELPEAKPREPDYFLRAKLIVPAAKFGDFEKAAAKILPKFEEGTGFRLEVASVEEVKPKPGEPEPAEKLIEVFHLWDIAKPENLLKAMTFLGDFPAYLALDELVTYADQDIVIALPRLGVVGRPGFSESDQRREQRVAQRHKVCDCHARYPVARVVSNFKKNQLDEILARYEEELPKTEADIKAKLVGGFLNITGDLNQIHWIWKLTEAKPGQRVVFEPRQLPDRGYVETTYVTIMKPAPYQHGLGRPQAAAPEREIKDYRTAAQ